MNRPKTLSLTFPTCHKTQSHFATKIYSQRNRLWSWSSHQTIRQREWNMSHGHLPWTPQFYISKIGEHLTDPSTYKELNSNPTHVIKNDVLSTLDYLHSTHQIDDETRHHLNTSKPVLTLLLSSLPKVHKPNIILRPIVSACDNPTNQPSNYVNHFIQPFVEILLSYI